MQINYVEMDAIFFASETNIDTKYITDGSLNMYSYLEDKLVCDKSFKSLQNKHFDSASLLGVYQDLVTRMILQYCF